MMRRAWIAIVLAIAARPAAAGSYTFTLPSAFTVAQDTPFTHTASGPALSGIIGYSFFGTWTAATGEPFSNELRIALATPSASYGAYAVGGVANSSTFVFPGDNFGTGGAAPVASPANSIAGNYSFTFSTTFGDTAATLTGASIALHYAPASYTATTAGGPTFTRPNDDGSAGSVAANYHVQGFTVAVSGRYMAALHADYDNMLYVYSGLFNPANPTANLLAVNDVGALGNNSSEMSMFLNAGTTYYIVATAFTAGDAGSFSGYVAGPGAVSLAPVPEPGWLLVSAAAGLLARWRRSSLPYFRTD
jgi:hypothetical protein